MIYLATDHAGFDLKEDIKKYLDEKEISYEDMGALEYNQEDDYPDFIYPAAKKVSDNPGSRGIILGGSGQGEAIVANKVSGIRAIVYYGSQKEILNLSREHNDANILSLGARFIDRSDIPFIIDTWLGSDFPKEERHARRIKKISEIEKYNSSVLPNEKFI